jgi:hypothetical protein
MDMAEDVDVFFDEDDFAVPVVRQRAGLPDSQPFSGIFGESVDEALEGYAVAVRRELRFARTDVREGDVLVVGGIAWRVMRVGPVNDGTEMLAFLAAVPVAPGPDAGGAP